MKSRVVSAAEPGWIRRGWERFSDYAIVLIGLAGLAALIFGVISAHSADNNSAAALTNSQVARANSAAAKAAAQKSLRIQKHYHQQNVASQAQIKQLLSEVKDEAAAIEYEGGVITFLSAENGQKDDEILAAQAQGHALLTAVAGLQMEINQDVPELRLGLNNGQAQINAYLYYLTCVGTNPTNATVCGAAPPLPTTT
jgi:hypothetical protein